MTDHHDTAALPPVLTVEETAKLLRISRGLAFAACHAGTIPHLRVGKRMLVPRDGVLALLATGTQPTS